MKCFKCGSGNTIHVDFDDGTEMLQCNDCGAKMTISQSGDNSSASVSTAPIVAAVEPAKKSIVNKEVILEKCQVMKNWVKNPISITSTVLNGVLLVVSIILLVCLCNSGPSVNDEIKNYALTNGYQWADFDTFNSPAKENGLGNTKVYISGKVKELKKVGSINVALVKDSENSDNIWGVVFLDNYMYSQLKEGKKVTIFGYYTGYSEKLKTPDVYYAYGYMDNKWFECNDSTGKLASFENSKTGKLIKDGAFTVTKDEMVDVINTIDNVTYVPMEYKGDTEYFYIGQIEKGVECTIVCAVDGETIKAIQITNDHDTAKVGAAFFSNLVKVLDPENHEKNVTQILKKWDLENIEYGATATCVVDDIYYVADFTHTDEIVLSIMPTSK